MASAVFRILLRVYSLHFIVNCLPPRRVQVVNGTQPSVVVLAPGTPGGGALFSFISPGSMDVVDVVRAAPNRYYVAAAGCATYGVCIDPGSDAYLWQILV